MEEKKGVNITFVPGDDPNVPRVYSNFFWVQHSPFDFTLTFCEMFPLSEREVQVAQAQAAENPHGTHTLKAPVRAKLVVPIPLIPGLVAALQENFRLHQEAYGPPKGGLH